MLYAQLGKKQKLSNGARYEKYMHYLYSRPHVDGTETFLLVGTSDCLIQINTSTYEIIPLLFYKDLQQSESLSPRHRDNLVQIARTYAFEFSEQMVSIVMGGAFRPIVNILEYSPILKDEKTEVQEEKLVLNFRMLCPYFPALFPQKVLLSINH